MNSERTVFEILPSAADSDADREVSSAADVAPPVVTVPVSFALAVIVAVIADYSPAAKLARGSSSAIAATMQPRRGAAPESARMSVSLFSLH